MTAPFRRLAGPLALFALACTATPLTNKIEVGEDAYVVGVGEGPDGLTDLYAAAASGGSVFRLTFNRPAELGPGLSAGGTLLAYIRSGRGAGGSEVVVLNLLSNAERRARLPDGAGPALRVAWLGGDRRIAAASPAGIWITDAPPAPLRWSRAAGGDSARADSALRIPLGDPVVALVSPCPGGRGVCVRSAGDVLDTLDSAGRGAVRWGSDSVGYWS
ncbi:MAG TPA: hypothetical protein VFN96_02815, partial [Gemmatimonadales bacterium]|nr:hypothetical protein [Gemmatimonadales bacterium]